MTATADTAAPTLIQGVAHSGYLIHAVPDNPDKRSRMRIGNLRFRGSALCGVRGQDAWSRYGFRLPGGYKDPVLFDTNLKDVCGKCATKVRRAEAGSAR